jgi:hypothetical protein
MAHNTLTRQGWLHQLALDDGGGRTRAELTDVQGGAVAVVDGEVRKVYG